MKKKMGIILIKKISLLLLLLSAALFSTSLAGRLCKSEESKKVSTTDDEEMESWGQLRNERILKVKTNDYGKYDPAPALVKPPFKLIPN
ncbi:protein CASPARIAN STRIP INTEGRITY FACTOR 1-like [Primulina eburnea]|uniref:protein CASPARIAN STRIP INTEGRITY FACTOR 1-like n=1 Tax=Primulina eburnea TaxID=1245227 RepID=UPI003C6C3EA9